MNEYNASSIKILKPTTEHAQFDWITAEDLASRYARPLPFIKRTMAACRECDVSIYLLRRTRRALHSIPGFREGDCMG